MFWKGWGDGITKPFGLRTDRLPIFNLPPVSPGRRPFFLGFMRVFGESYLPLLGAIRWSVNTEFPFIPYLYIGVLFAWMFRAKKEKCYTIVTPREHGKPTGTVVGGGRAGRSHTEGPYLEN